MRNPKKQKGYASAAELEIGEYCILHRMNPLKDSLWYQATERVKGENCDYIIVKNQDPTFPYKALEEWRVVFKLDEEELKELKLK